MTDTYGYAIEWNERDGYIVRSSSGRVVFYGQTHEDCERWIAERAS